MKATTTDFLDHAKWTTPPIHAERDGRKFSVQAAAGSDFWQETHYGLSRDSGHALLVPIAPTGSIEVTFKVTFEHLYDQAGLMIRNDQTNWIKAGVEISDGVPHIGAVVTHGQSDWSLNPVPEWAGTEVSIRASWSDGATTIRAKSGDEPWRTLRLAPLTFASSSHAGLYLCAPDRDGLEVSFSRISFGQPDADLHSQPAPHG
jgi:regulation of enolase protein 1 (concanavalin A-like superfamily)